MSLSKAEWGIVEERLQWAYRPVALMCDGYHVILVVQPHKELTSKIYVYVNDKLRFHEKNNPEEVTRFSFPSQRYAWKASARAEMKKMPKRMLKKYGYDPDEKFTVYLPWWSTFKALKAHLVKHNERLELLKTWQYKPAKGAEEAGR